MKAIVLTDYGGVENFALADVSDPTLSPDDLRVQVRAASFNPIDYQIRRGGSESKLVGSPILGRDFAGEVSQVGAAVTGWQVGDAVFGYSSSMGSNGTYAEQLCVPANVVGRVPPSLTYAQAAALPVVGLTALHAWQVARVAPTHSVLVVGGAGGVGTLLLQLASHFGVGPLSVTAGSAASTQHVQALGVPAARIVDYRRPNVSEALLASNAHQLFDVVIDLVGGELSQTAAEVLAIGGTYVDVAFLGTEGTRSTLFDKATTIHNVAIYAHAQGNDPVRRARFGRQLAELAALVQAGILPPPPINVVGGFSPETVRLAHRRLEAHQTQGKLVMVFGEGS